MYDTLIRNVSLLDGTGTEAIPADVALLDGRIARIADAGTLPPDSARHTVNGHGRVLSPGFIDVHTHDDLAVIDTPTVLPKLSQGVTTVIVGNCGISASPARLTGYPPEPINLLGSQADFRFPEFEDYATAVAAAQPAVNVGALVGHTSLRATHMAALDRAATEAEITAMRSALTQALAQGALGLSTGLAYANANSAPTDEVMALAEALSDAGGLYVTHMRDESAAVLEAMEEAFRIGRHARVPVMISHMKCLGKTNWGLSPRMLGLFDRTAKLQPIGCDCYPYAASSTVLSPRAATGGTPVMVTWSEPHPEVNGRMLADIAADWDVDLATAVDRLRPAAAVYFSMEEGDVSNILAHPAASIGSDGSGRSDEAFTHPRLWGTFPRVLGHYSRDQGLFSLAEAVRKMTSLSAARFGLAERGVVREGYWADLVLFDPATVRDTATFTQPAQLAEGIDGVWVNGTLSYQGNPQENLSSEAGDGPRMAATGQRAGQFLRRGPLWTNP